MRRSALFPVLSTALLTAIHTGRAQAPLPAGDLDRVGAESKWGAASVGNESLRASVWNEPANTDGDSRSNFQEFNFQEFAFDSNPTARPSTGPVTRSTTVTPGHFALTYKARQNAPALIMLPQSASNPTSWYPLLPVAVSPWAGDPSGTFTEAAGTPTVANYAAFTEVDAAKSFAAEMSHLGAVVSTQSIL